MTLKRRFQNFFEHQGKIVKYDHEQSISEDSPRIRQNLLGDAAVLIVSKSLLDDAAAVSKSLLDSKNCDKPSAPSTNAITKRVMTYVKQIIPTVIWKSAAMPVVHEVVDFEKMAIIVGRSYSLLMVNERKKIE